MSGHSMAAHVIGEWIYNFGPAGAVLMVPFVGMGVKLLDLTLARLQGFDVLAPTRVALTAGVATVVAEVPTLVWVGSFTFTSRAGQRVAIILALWAVARLLHTDRAGRSSRPKSERGIAPGEIVNSGRPPRPLTSGDSGSRFGSDRLRSSDGAGVRGASERPVSQDELL